MQWVRQETVGELKKRMLDYNPYREIEIVEPGLLEPAREEYPLEDWMAGMYLRDRIQREWRTSGMELRKASSSNS